MYRYSYLINIHSHFFLFFKVVPSSLVRKLLLLLLFSLVKKYHFHFTDNSHISLVKI